MAKFSVGQIVFSKCGRDKGFAFVIIRMEEEFAYIADGKLRILSKPKKKKKKHLQPTNWIDAHIAEAVEYNKYILDSDLRKAVTGFTNADRGRYVLCRKVT